MGYVSRKNNHIHYDHLVRKANLSILNTRQIKKLTRLKFLTFKYETHSAKLVKGCIYKSIGENDKKIIFFDTIISYEKKPDGTITRPFYNIYIPTLFIDYLNFAYKNCLLAKPDEIKIEDLPRLEREIYLIFASQNKNYTYDDYKKIKEEFNLDKDSNYKTRIKALHEYTVRNNSIPGFYFFLAVMYDIIPIKYMGKTTISSNLKLDYKNIFFVEPEDSKVKK